MAVDSDVWGWSVMEISSSGVGCWRIERLKPDEAVSKARSRFRRVGAFFARVGSLAALRTGSRAGDVLHCVSLTLS